uniref:Dihydrolipoamide dehydrogenase n=1 Tax=uncultured prokaryote TaxID=198431 RepID=H5SEL9_9ZZZZ|nr:dihydrolipoamide dehydrogenase [uncultured prokaryote]
MDKKGKNVVVIGGGPGGYPCAVLLARSGFDTILVEKRALGGTCLQFGCIPSKTLINAAKRLKDLNDIRNTLMGDIPTIRYADLIKHSREKVENITAGLDGIMKLNGVKVVKGRARFKDRKRVFVEKEDGAEEFSPDYVVIAVGSRARMLPGVPYPHERVLTNIEVLSATTPPEKLIIVGGGAIGCEFASFFSALNIPVTIIEHMSRLLPQEDEDISRELQTIFRKNGISVITGRKVTKTDVSSDSVRITLDDQTVIEGSHILVAIGIAPATDDLGLEDAGIGVDERGYIPVRIPDYQVLKGPEGVYAIGDCISIPGRVHPCFAHVATREGEIVASVISGKPFDPLDYTNIPICTFTLPEVARIGLTEDEAKKITCSAPAHEVLSVKVRYGALGKGISLNHREGFIKIVEHRDKYHRKPIRQIAGAHIIGEGASELIHIIAASRHAEDSIGHMKGILFQHPTWSELIGEALRLLDDEAVHVRGRKP